MKSTKVAGVLFAAVAVVFVSWVLYRARYIGIGNVFAREHVFLDTRSLTEEVAIDITRKTLEADGHDMSVFTPFESSGPPLQDRHGQAERIFERDRDSDGGRIHWLQKHENGIVVAVYSVRFVKNGDEIRSLAILQK